MKTISSLGETSCYIMRLNCKLPFYIPVDGEVLVDSRRHLAFHRIIGICRWVMSWMSEGVSQSVAVLPEITRDFCTCFWGSFFHSWKKRFRPEIPASPFRRETHNPPRTRQTPLSTTTGPTRNQEPQLQGWGMKNQSSVTNYCTSTPVHVP